jgi:hypothetical protein
VLNDVSFCMSSVLVAFSRSRGYRAAFSRYIGRNPDPKYRRRSEMYEISSSEPYHERSGPLEGQPSWPTGASIRLAATIVCFAPPRTKRSARSCQLCPSKLPSGDRAGRRLRGGEPHRVVPRRTLFVRAPGFAPSARAGGISACGSAPLPRGGFRFRRPSLTR